MKETTLQSITNRIQNSQNVMPVVLAAIVGLLAGFGAIAFRYLIQAAHRLFFDVGGQLSAQVDFLHIEKSYIIVVPAIGMLIVSAMIRRWAIEAQGHGVPEVQYAVKREGGRIPLRVGLVKAIASALCIGSGGSVGREGPIVQIGCSLGSAVGQAARLQESGVKILVACGAAGAIGGTFNAPIAGVLFALEIILGNFAARSFGLVVISSVTATAVCHAFLGKQPAFALSHPFVLQSPWELPLYLVLGLLVGVISLTYMRSVYFFEDGFARWKSHPAFKALVGGLVIGALGFFGSEHIFGVGYKGVEMALQSVLPMRLLLLLLVLKMFATSITLGAGGSGGVFAPSLFIGAMAGSAFGLLVNQLFPAITAPAGAYALVGMAALFAGSAHAPITSILIVFEMTDDYKIILPLMLSVVVSYLIASRLNPDSIYTLKLRRRGGFAHPKTEVSILDTILVMDAMTTQYTSVHPEMTVSKLVRLLRKNLIRSCPVLDSDDRLVGIVTEYDIERALVDGHIQNSRVSEIMTTDLIHATPHETLRVVLRQIMGKDVHQIPVVDKENSQKLLGVLRRSEILWAYHELVDEHQRLLAKTGLGLPTHSTDSVQIEVEVRPEQSKLCFKKIRDLALPDHCIIAMLRRAGREVIPRGHTVIEPGDFLVLLTTRSHERQLRNWVAHLSRRAIHERPV